MTTQTINDSCRHELCELDHSSSSIRAYDLPHCEACGVELTVATLEALAVKLSADLAPYFAIAAKRALTAGEHAAYLSLCRTQDTVRLGLRELDAQARAQVAGVLRVAGSAL